MEDSTSHSLIAPNLRIPSLTPTSVSSPQTTQVPGMPSTCIVTAVSWEIKSRIHKAQQKLPDPANSPRKALLVPDSVHSEVLQWAHSTHVTCHPGMNRTLAFLHQRFWWPTVQRHVREFVSACSVCARNKTSNKPTSSLLRHLPIPSPSWSHIALGFVTGLPPSNGNSVILTIRQIFQGGSLHSPHQASILQ